MGKYGISIWGNSKNTINFRSVPILCTLKQGSEVPISTSPNCAFFKILKHCVREAAVGTRHGFSHSIFWTKNYTSQLGRKCFRASSSKTWTKSTGAKGTRTYINFQLLSLKTGNDQERQVYLPSLANFGTMRFSIIFYDVLLLVYNRE